MTHRPQKPLPIPKDPGSAQQAKKHKDELLDEALKDTFPASDPPAMLQPVPNVPPEEKGNH
jgi:hypothetical protein